ncbi:hypothetical protein V2J09_004152 [Rumex salicifolius]
MNKLTAARGKFSRICVEIDITQLLLGSLMVNGEKVSIPYALGVACMVIWLINVIYLLVGMWLITPRKKMLMARAMPMARVMLSRQKWRLCVNWPTSEILARVALCTQNLGVSPNLKIPGSENHLTFHNRFAGLET